MRILIPITLALFLASCSTSKVTEKSTETTTKNTVTVETETIVKPEPIHEILPVIKKDVVADSTGRTKKIVTGERKRDDGSVAVKGTYDEEAGTLEIEVNPDSAVSRTKQTVTNENINKKTDTVEQSSPWYSYLLSPIGWGLAAVVVAGAVVVYLRFRKIGKVIG